MRRISFSGRSELTRAAVIGQPSTPVDHSTHSSLRPDMNGKPLTLVVKAKTLNEHVSAIGVEWKISAVAAKRARRSTKLIGAACREVCGHRAGHVSVR